ncbi:unnamed protein product [Rotaria sordida]|uniref:Reverse transcriptase domain-containing protein n=1 Tax=Rotaria sordida TaxID=392033 RepID=A0A819LU65_9BILA|nr:unnamed protein product [Rotaria sordida]
MSMFINGLKYVPPCQIRYIRKPSIDKKLTEQYENISNIVKQCLKDNIMSTTDERAKQAFSDLERIVQELKHTKISKKLHYRARFERRIVRGIQNLLRQRPDVVLCRADKTKALYCGSKATMVAKAYEYMTRTNAYETITNDHCPLTDIVNAVNGLLDSLVKQKGLTIRQANKLRPNLNRLELAHFHGLPKTHKDGTPLRPIIASINAPTTLISKFLNNLLAPIYLQVARETTFINDIDTVRKLEKYVSHRYLTSTTQFITADVKDLYTMIPRDGAIAALIRFLEKYSYHGKIGTLSIDHIVRMARLILDTNYFAYEKTYYRQKRGGAMGSAFTQVLANIYMLEWEQDLIRYQTQHHEIYGRYIDDIFMTTNQTTNEIINELNKAAQKDINIQIEYKISTSVDFLDVTITNENGHLRTSIYHKPTAEPYILPFTSDHPRHIHRNIPYAALLRAVRLCSHVDDFHMERIRIDMSLLLNHYPPKFITKHIDRFFRLNNVISILKRVDQQQVYEELHKKLLEQLTRREKTLKTMMQDSIKNPQVLQTKIWDRNVMYPRYQFDSGLTLNFRRSFHSWWLKHYVFPTSNVNNVRIRLVPQMNRTLEHFFIRKKPPHEMLTKKEPST